MKVTKTKIYMAGVSISLALALAASGGETTSSTNGIKTAGSATLSTLGKEVKVQADGNPVELQVDSATHNSLTVSFSAFSNLDAWADADGIIISYAKLPISIATSSDWNVSDPLEWINADLNRITFWEKAQYGWEIEDKFDVNTRGDGLVRYDNDTSNGLERADAMTINELDLNSTYVLRVGSISLQSGDIAGSSTPTGLDSFSDAETWGLLVAQGTTLPVPPCLEVTAFSHMSEGTQECNTNNDCNNDKECDDRSRALKSSRCFTPPSITYGAHPTWCFDKDEQGVPTWDGAELYRQTWGAVTEA